MTISQAINDGSFELGSPNPYWSEYSSVGAQTITQVHPLTGSWSADFCAYPCLESVTQNFIVPSNVVSATLRYSLLVESFVDTCSSFMGVGISNTDGTGVTGSNSHKFCANSSQFNYANDSIDETSFLQANPNQTKTVYGLGSTASGDDSQFFVDDVALSITYNPPTVPGPPGNVSATGGNASAMVSWSAPAGNGGSPITGYTVATYDAKRQFVSSAQYGSSPANVTSLLNGVPYYFTVAATNSVGTGAATPSNSVTPVAGTTPPARMTAPSTTQYTLPNSDGSTWQVMDESNLSLSIITTGAEDVLLSTNADLWTWNPGFNQDIGITVNDALVAWKESGGYAGTFSPNAAFLETAYHMASSTTYSVKVVWKANKAAIGASVSAGAGPINAAFSPTRLSAKVLPSTAGGFQTASSTTQYSLANSNGSGWQAVDGTNLSLTMSPASTEDVVVSGNADLWTWNAGYNQDIGIFVSGGSFPTGTGQPEAWKESGGYAGTFSPNAASVQTVLHFTGGGVYTVQLVWKTNKPANGAQISMGAGPISGVYSPTRLTAWVLPAGANQWASGVSTQQYALPNSDGGNWQQVDATNLTATITPTLDEDTLVSGNADLWTSNSGYNQDIALFVTDTGGLPALLAWKESGGYGGTFSPNAAFVQTAFHMVSGHTYVFSLLWKANKSASGATIWAGAGPIGGAFSPTRLSVVPD